MSWKIQSIGRVRTSAGVQISGDFTAEWATAQSFYNGGSTWRVGNTPPAIYTHYLISGILITEAFTYAKNHSGQYVPLFEINGYTFYIIVTDIGLYSFDIFVRYNNTYYAVGDSLYLEQAATVLSVAVCFGKSDAGNYAVLTDVYYRQSGIEYYSAYLQYVESSWTVLNAVFDGLIPLTDDPYSTEINETEPGGYGPFDYTSETETPPQLPAVSAAQVGFVSLWNPTQTEMRDLASYLWTGTFDLTNFKKLFTDPMECVLSVGIIPITPTRKQVSNVDTKEEIVFGGSSHSGVNAYPVTEQFYIVDMGMLHIGGMSNGALDYSPYAKASIYLPYCGTYALDVDEIMDSDISLEYHIDIYTGACVAYLTIDGHLNSDGHNVNAVMYQFTGNVLASIPITGNDHNQFIQSMLFMGAAAAATVATSGAGAGAAASAGPDLGAETAATGFNKALAGSAVNTVMSMKPNVLHSGNLSTTAGMLGGQKPFITMTWSNLCRPEDEYKLVGLPLHKSGTLSDFKGFTIVSACHMDNILCTDTELQMIEQALAKGVIL